jgi:hypothetical protein
MLEKIIYDLGKYLIISIIGTIIGHEIHNRYIAEPCEKAAEEIIKEAIPD